MMRKILLSAGLLAAVGVAALYFPLDFLRPSVERALERGLGRKAEVGHVYVNLFGVPGFTFEDVTIHEDPRAGIEPFAYVPSLNAGVRVLSLLRRRLAFSSLSLGDATINVVKTTDGTWNFQLFPQKAVSQSGPPSIKMRRGRINFKVGEIKSVFYFNDADLDVTPYGTGSVELRFGGAPSRTDRAAPEFGHLFVRGNWTSAPTPHLDARVELERGSLDEISRLIDPRGFGVQGFVSIRTQIGGPPSALQIAGALEIEDFSRWDLLPRGGSYELPLKGTLDLATQNVEMATVADASSAPFSLQFRGANMFAKPNWDVRARVQKLPLADVIEIARHMGAEVPDKLTAEGSVSGEVGYTREGIAGEVELTEASLALPDAKALRAPSAAVSIRDGSMYLASTTVEIGEKQTTEIEGNYRIEAPRGLDLRIATRGMNVADMRSFGLAAIPLLEQTSQGTWRGWARYRGGEWSGEYDLQNARIAVEGLADPFRIQAASVKLNGKRVLVNRLRARVGKVGFTGDYRWEPEAIRPHKFNVLISEADAMELARLLAPALSREQGFLARTLRLAPSPPPNWLKARRADGTVSIGALAFGDTVVRLDRARILWDATQVRLAGLDGHVLDADTDQAAIAGDMEVGLDRGAPHFKFDGTVAGVPYKGGTLDFEGTLEADGMSTQLLESARAEGRVRGRSINFASDAEFRTANACFSLLGSPSGPVWRLGEVEAVQGGEIYTGTGVSQPDGKLVLDLSRGGRPVRFAAALLAGAP